MESQQKMDVLQWCGIAGLFTYWTLDLYYRVKRNNQIKENIDKQRTYSITAVENLMKKGEISKYQTDFEKKGDLIIGKQVIILGQASKIGLNTDFNKKDPLYQYVFGYLVNNVNYGYDLKFDTVNNLVKSDSMTQRRHIRDQTLRYSKHPYFFFRDIQNSNLSKYLVKGTEDAKVEFTPYDFQQIKDCQKSQSWTHTVIKGIDTSLLVFRAASTLKYLDYEFNHFESIIGFDEYELKINFDTPFQILGEVVIDLKAQTIRFDKIDYIFQTKKFIQGFFPTTWNSTKMIFWGIMAGWAIQKLYKSYQQYQQERSKLSKGNQTGLSNINNVFSDVDERGNCKSCKSTIPELILLPCSHTCICKACYQQDTPKNCPTCSNQIIKTVSIFVT